MIPFKPKTARAAKFSAVLATALLSTTAAGLAQIPADQISPKALKQMVKILKNKGTFSDAEQKISSNIALASREARFLPIGGTDQIIDRTNISSDGLATVKITAKVNNTVKALIKANGGTITSVDKAHDEIMAKVPLTALAAVAESDQVTSIDEPDIRISNVGAVTTQGYVTHRAKNVVEGLGYDGTGVKIGVLSDSASATSVAARQATGDLPANTVVVTAGSGEDEGTAIMEIVHDMAPGAQPYFNTGTTAATFATAITTLGTLGCKVIVDDISFSNEGVFQDDTIAKAVNSFVATGGIYFSSAANSGNLESGTSGTWEGDFLSGGTPATPVTDGGTPLIHNFGTAANPVLYDTLTVASTLVTLKWSDPLTGGTDDYDLFVLDSTGSTVLKSSTNRQTGARAPYESCTPTATDPVTAAVDFPVGSRIVIVQYNGTALLPKTTLTRALHLDTNRAALSIGTNGNTFGHNAAANTQSVAATFWNSGKLGHHAIHRRGQPGRAFQFRWTSCHLLQPGRIADRHRHADFRQSGRRHRWHQPAQA